MPLTKTEQELTRVITIYQDKLDTVTARLAEAEQLLRTWRRHFNTTAWQEAADAFAKSTPDSANVCGHGTAHWLEFICPDCGGVVKRASETVSGVRPTE